MFLILFLAFPTIRMLIFRSDGVTTTDASTRGPQLRCIGGKAAHMASLISQVVCYSKDPQDESLSAWRCEAPPLDKALRISNLSMRCDDAKPAGSSCYVQYELEYSSYSLPELGTTTPLEKREESSVSVTVAAIVLGACLTCVGLFIYALPKQYRSR